MKFLIYISKMWLQCLCDILHKAIIIGHKSPGRIQDFQEGGSQRKVEGTSLPASCNIRT